MKLVDPLYLRAICFPDAPFLNSPQGTWSNFAVETRVNQIIALCRDYKIQQGEKVGILADNHPAYIFWILALTRIGAISVCLNLRLSLAEITKQLQMSLVHFLVTDQMIDLEDITIINLFDYKKEKTICLAPILDLEQQHSVFFSSGTTGSPKAISLTLGNHYYSAAGVICRLGITQLDHSWLLCLPLFHVAAFAIVWRCLYAGLSIFLIDRFDASRVIEIVNNNKIGWISFVPTMLIRVLDHPSFLASLTNWQKLKGIMTGGAPMTPQLQERCLRLKLPILTTYGLTEASSTVATLTPTEWQNKPRSSGTPVPGIQLKIEDGQIKIKGRPVYHQGWFNTKDAGYFDEDGYLFVTDRLDDMIICGGENIYPSEIEAVLLQHPHILEACIFGKPDAEWGQVPVALIVAEKTIGLEQVKEWCKSLGLASYKVPKQVIIVKDIPKTASGKIHRPSLAMIDW